MKQEQIETPRSHVAPIDWTTPVNTWAQRYVYIHEKAVKQWRKLCGVPLGSFAGFFRVFKASVLISDRAEVQRLRNCQPNMVLADCEYYYHRESGVMFVVRRRENPNDVPERFNENGNRVGRHRSIILGTVSASKE